MRYCPILLILLFSASVASAAEIEARSEIDSVMVYPDGATVTRVIRVDLPAGDSTLIASDFPPGLDASSLRVEGETAARIMIGAIDARAPKAVPPVNAPELENKIEAARDQRNALEDKIAAESARKHFAERFGSDAPLGLGDKAEARPLAEWRAAFVAVAEDIAAADNAIRELKLAQREIDREIARLEAQARANPPRKLQVRIDLASDAPTTGTLRVSYAVRGARWLPLYDARLDTGGPDRKPALELVRRAEITQSTGEDWSNVALAVSTVRTARGGSAPDLNSLIVQYPQAPRPLGAAAFSDMKRQMPAPAAPEPPAQRADEQQAAVEIGGFQVMFRIPGRVSVGASEGAKSLRVSTATIAPDLAVRAAPVRDPTAFLEASFAHGEDAPLLPGRVAIYRDGIFVGRGQMAAAGKDETVRLGFGADDKVKIERAVVKRNEGSAGLIVTTSKTDERAFKTSVRNGHDFPIRVAIEDQLPVSENEDIVVEMLPSTTPPTTTNLRDRRGVLEWAFEAKPGEAKDIAFAWRVRWPKDKGVVMVPAG